MGSSDVRWNPRRYRVLQRCSECVSVRPGQNVRNVRSVGAGGSLVEAELSNASSVVGHTVAQTSWPREVVLVSIARGDRVIVPRGDVTMDAGDRLTIYTTPAGRDALGVLLGVTVQEQTV